MDDTVKKLNSLRAPIIEIDNSLKKYSNKLYFPEKLEKANEILKKAGLPIDLINAK